MVTHMWICYRAVWIYQTSRGDRIRCRLLDLKWIRSHIRELLSQKKEDVPRVL